MVLHLLLSMQAIPVGPPPEPGRWVFRESLAREGGARGISATLLAEDESARLAVRCDLSYDRTVSVQFLPSWNVGLSFAAPLSLDQVAGAETLAFTFRLIWELDVRGAYARDGEDDSLASDAAVAIARAPSRLRVRFVDRDGAPSRAYFNNREGREAVRRVLEACPWPVAEE